MPLSSDLPSNVAAAERHDSDSSQGDDVADVDAVAMSQYQQHRSLEWLVDQQPNRKRHDHQRRGTTHPAKGGNRTARHHEECCDGDCHPSRYDFRTSRLYADGVVVSMSLGT
jgi:hypothetical protein